MQERAFGTVQGGVVELRSPLPEGAPVDVIVLGAPLDVMQRLRTRQAIDWQETAVNGDGRSYVERMDPEVPAILRANGAEEQFALERGLLVKHFPDLISLTVEAEEDRESPGVLWVSTEAVVPGQTEVNALLQRERALTSEMSKTVPHRIYGTLHLTHHVRGKED